MDANRSDQRLVWAGYLFAIGSAVHLFDHLRRGQDSVTEQLFWAGNLALVVQVAVITLIVVRHRVAPVAAVAAGFPLALGFSAAHWLPRWSELSDSFVDEGAPLFSYVASSLEIAGALAIGFAGLAIIRARGLAATTTPGSRATVA